MIQFFIIFYYFIEEDSQKKCFVCNIDKFTFEKAGIDFEKHYNTEHNIWNYVNFLVYMKEKTEKDCNGIETELFRQISESKLNWMPVGRSISLGT